MCFLFLAKGSVINPTFFVFDLFFGICMNAKSVIEEFLFLFLFYIFISHLCNFFWLLRQYSKIHDLQCIWPDFFFPNYYYYYYLSFWGTETLKRMRFRISGIVLLLLCQKKRVRFTNSNFILVRFVVWDFELDHHILDLIFGFGQYNSV